MCYCVSKYILIRFAAVKEDIPINCLEAACESLSPIKSTVFYCVNLRGFFFQCLAKLKGVDKLHCGSIFQGAAPGDSDLASRVGHDCVSRWRRCMATRCGDA